MASKIIFESKKPPITHATADDMLMTNYDLEYKKKHVPKVLPYIPPDLMPELEKLKSNPITEPFRQDLLPDYERNQKEDPENYESGSCYYQRLVKKKPSITKIVDNEVNQTVLTDEHNQYDNRTVYQIEFCKQNDYMLAKKVGITPKAIPDVWKPVPLSTYGLSFKDHSKTATWNIVPEPAKPPPSFFDPNPQEREILNVHLGESEYEGVIGRLGTEVIKKEYHGHIDPLPGEFIPPTEDSSNPQ